MADNYHLTFNRDEERWEIKREGASRPSDHFESHSKALQRARELALHDDVDLVVHDDTGAITGSESAEDIGKGTFARAADAVSDKVQGAVGAVTGAFKS